MNREQRLDYERRILAAEVETVRLARRSKRFAELIQRNTSTLDAALTVANFDADKRGYDRLVVEPWMPTLLSLLDDIAQILPEDDNQKGLISEKQPKSVEPVMRSAVAAWLRGEEAEEEATRVLFAVPEITDETFGEMARKVCKQLAYMVEYRADFASCDTHPTGGDSTEIEAPASLSGAVGATSAETPNPSPSPAAGR